MIPDYKEPYEGIEYCFSEPCKSLYDGLKGIDKWSFDYWHHNHWWFEQIGLKTIKQAKEKAKEMEKNNIKELTRLKLAVMTHYIRKNRAYKLKWEKAMYRKLKRKFG